MRYQVTFPDAIAVELEQYAYAKRGQSVSRLLHDAVLSEVARNGLTVGQWTRLVEKYGNASKSSLMPAQLERSKEI